MNNPNADTPWDREPERFGMLIAGLVGRGLAGDLPPDEDSVETFAARLNDSLAPNPAALIEGYMVLASYLIENLAASIGQGATIDKMREFPGLVMGGTAPSREDEASPSRDDVLRDVRLSVLGSVRILLQDGSDEDLARMQNYNSAMMLPEAINFLCLALGELDDPAAVLDRFTHMTLQDSLN